MSSISTEEFTSKQYDYVIIGGGTAGLVVAARLTEDPNITVAVLEAGENRLDVRYLDNAYFVFSPQLTPRRILKSMCLQCSQIYTTSTSTSIDGRR
jgi:choline dehydrogenase-like flavoprotein